MTLNTSNPSNLIGYSNVDYEQQTVMYDINDVSTTETKDTELGLETVKTIKHE